MYNNQDVLRQEARVAKAKNHEDFSYSDFADIINITVDSFYNWLNGQYNLSSKKAKELHSFLSDLL